jgi:hypothetical protein
MPEGVGYGGLWSGLKSLIKSRPKKKKKKKGAKRTYRLKDTHEMVKELDKPVRKK